MKFLSLAGNKISSFNFSFNNLEVLNLNSNSLIEINGNFKRLHILHLESNNLSNLDFLFPYLSSIQNLYLGNNLSEDETVKLLMKLCSSKNLKTLNLSSNFLTLKLARTLYQVFQFHPSLEVLILSNTGLCQQGSNWITRLINENRNLTFLDLRCCKLHSLVFG